MIKTFNNNKTYFEISLLPRNLYDYHESYFLEKILFTQHIELPLMNLHIVMTCGHHRFSYQFLIRNVTIYITDKIGKHKIILFSRDYEYVPDVVYKKMQRKDIHTHSAHEQVKKWYHIDKSAKELFFDARNDGYIEFAFYQLKKAYVLMFGA